MSEEDLALEDESNDNGSVFVNDSALVENWTKSSGFILEEELFTFKQKTPMTLKKLCFLHLKVFSIFNKKVLWGRTKSL